MRSMCRIRIMCLRRRVSSCSVSSPYLRQLCSQSHSCECVSDCVSSLASSCDSFPHVHACVCYVSRVRDGIYSCISFLVNTSRCVATHMMRVVRARVGAWFLRGFVACVFFEWVCVVAVSCTIVVFVLLYACG